jgi:hypothetical protein
MTSSKTTLKIAAILSFTVAIFQAGISFSPSWGLYFGAPETLTARPLLLILAGLLMTVVFVIFGLYALSGAGVVRPLPLLKTGLWVVSGIYILRGLMLIPQLLIDKGIQSSSETIGFQSLASSMVALFIGLVYIAGSISGRGSGKI